MPKIVNGIYKVFGPTSHTYVVCFLYCILLSTHSTVGCWTENPGSTSTFLTNTASLQVCDVAAYSPTGDDNAITFKCFEAKLVGASMK